MNDIFINSRELVSVERLMSYKEYIIVEHTIKRSARRKIEKKNTLKNNNNKTNILTFQRAWWTFQIL